jgi:hypothetical protein
VSDDDRIVISVARGGTGGKYWALATWDGQQWQVRIDDHNEMHRADTTASTLAEVGPIASMVLAALFGCHPDHIAVSVEARLPDTVTTSLRAAEGLVAQATPHVQSGITGLRHQRVRDSDITTILAARPLTADADQTRG